MNRVSALVVGVVLLLTSIIIAQSQKPPSAGAGDIQSFKPVACRASDLPLIVVSHNWKSLNFFRADKTSGLSSSAMVADASYTVIGPGNSERAFRFKIAIDSSTGSSEPEKIMFDFSGRGTFDKNAALPLKKAEDGDLQTKSWVLRPATLEFHRNGRKIIAELSGSVARGTDSTYATGKLGAALEGICFFGNRNHAVRIIGAFGDFAFDKPCLYDKEGKLSAYGDVVLIDEDDSGFAAPVSAFLEQPVCVDGSWHTVKVSDGKMEAVAATNIKTSSVSVKAKKWEALLLQGNKAFLLSGSGKDVPVPAGNYSMAFVKVWNDTTEDAPYALIFGKKEFQAEENKALCFANPLPLKGVLAVGPDTKDPRQLHISFELGTNDNMSVFEVVDSQTSLPARPKVVIFDASGKQVYQTTLGFS